MGLFGYAALRGITNVEPVRAEAPPPDRDQLLRQRGAYLLAAMGCHDCHSPHDNKGQMIAGRELSGHPEGAPLAQWDPSLLDRNILVTISPTLTSFAGPWGVSVAANITPDKETGIGNLTAEGLIRSWRSGKHWKLTRDILPPMPAPAFQNLSDDDIRALHAFLMSLPPTKNKAPDLIAPSPPANG
jgi:mono/diheme cytochrome c family protein